MFNTISMIGLGYIGLPTATLFASRKKKVIGIDVSSHVVDTINSGKIHIVEPELDMLVHAAVTAGFLRASLTPEPADAFLIAVPTPFKDGHKPDLSYIESAARAIAPVLAKGNLVVLESTSPVGTTDQLSAWMAAARPDLSFPQQAGEEADVQVAHCPERVLPGKVVHELVSNDRVIGGMTTRASEMATALYKTFVAGECITTTARTAELCKLTENSFRDVNIAFANELSLVCAKLGIDVWELIRLANRHPRVKILQPGPGVGGHCIAVDPWFIVDSAPDESRLIRTARLVNDHKPEWVLEQVAHAIKRVKKGPATNVAVLGLAFKPNIDDLRESPAMHIAQRLSDEDHTLWLVEPNVHHLPSSLAKHTLLSAKEAIARADVVVVLVAHKEFLSLTDSLRAHGAVVDAVGLLRITSR
jgi:UDP-N-acetyl-D-mannosaminuronic acid dehydrogenase